MNDISSSPTGKTAVAGRTWRPATQLVRGGMARSGFDETSEALYLTSGFVYPDAASAEAAFANKLQRFVYSRFANPTVANFEERLR
jgi:O-succinylhomoserine sulfhydrylase